MASAACRDRSAGKLKALLHRRGTPIADFDLAIAAHALAHDAVLVTCDTAHMTRVPRLQLDDWTRD